MGADSPRLRFRFPRDSCAFASAPKDMEFTSSKLSGEVSVSESMSEPD